MVRWGLRSLCRVGLHARTVVKDIANMAWPYLLSKYREDIKDGLVSGTIDGWDGGGQRNRSSLVTYPLPNY